MSGRNQHHFWQVLQRGFGLERKPDYTTVFVYQKDREPFPVGTRNFGAERDFFDFEPGSGADSLITKTENELQGLVRYLQNGGQVTTDHTASLSMLIAHLETRTKFIRQHFAETVSDLMSELNGWFADPVIFRKVMKRYASENPDEIDALLAKEISDPITRSAITEFLIDNFEKLDQKLFKTVSNNIADSMKSFLEEISETAKKSHIKALLNTPSGNPRQSRYLGLNYRLKSGFDGNLICPDTMATFLTARKPKPFLDKDDQLESVWIPLTSDLMLIGEPRASADRSNQSVLRVLASTSYSAFIASSDSSQLRALMSRIGKNAHILSASDIKAVKREFLKGLQ